jgi:3'-phosphoadenosine 5'-phosphosulfate sulfotransferase (PAPS reductase)/FAD synthetase
MSKVIASFSGGKDSTCMLLEMIRRKEHIDEVVFFDTGWEFPQMYEHVAKVKRIVEDAGIKFTTLHPEVSFDYLMFDVPVKDGKHCGYSWCGLKGCRWGTTCKLRAIDNYFKSEPEHIQCVGIAINEPERLNKERKGNKRFPLAEYGFTEADCLKYCYELGFDWGGLYKLLDRVSCKYCGLKNLKELRNIYVHIPDVWEELRDYQRRSRLPYRGNGETVFDLEKRFDLQSEFETQGKSTRSQEFYNELRKRLG